MNVIWDERAKNALIQIFDYIYDTFGEKSESKFQQEVLHTVQLLQSNPCMAALEPLLLKRSKTYRSSIINKLSKMVYYVDDDTIHVAAFWDCRQDPLAQTDFLE